MITFDPVQKTLDEIRFGIQTESTWPVIPKYFEVANIYIALDITDVIGPGLPAVQGLVRCTFSIGDVFLQCQIQKQASDVGWTMSAGLPPGGTIDLIQIAGRLFDDKIQIPAERPPSMAFSVLQISIETGTGLLRCSAHSADEWDFLGVDRFAIKSFDLDFVRDPSRSDMPISGTLSTTLGIGTVEILLSASLNDTPGGGWQFQGGTRQGQPVPVGQLIDYIATTFGVDDLPRFISSITLRDLAVSFNTTSKDFTFGVTGLIPVAQADLSIDLNVSVLRQEDGSYMKAIGGTFTVGGAIFTLSSKSSDSGASLAATWQKTQGQSFGFEDLCSAFGWSPPPIPASLDLELTSASISYDSGSDQLALTATSETYGRVVFATLLIGGEQHYFFLLGVDRSFDLSDLPLVGSELAKIETVSIDQIQVIIGSMTADASVATLVNGLIDNLAPGYPTMPDGGTSGDVVVTARANLGDEPRPLCLSLGGVDSQGATAPRLAIAAEGPAGQVASSSGPDGTTWFTVQKSFGPVSIQRIGAMYQSSQQMLWFEIDATLAFGPLSLGLMGLGVGSPLSDFSPGFNLQGLGLSYSNPPLEIAGALINLAPPGSTYIEFEGGIAIGAGEFTVEAFGYYGNKLGFSSMFLFGDVAYDFGGPPAFFVTGLALGFGYNSQVTIPTVDQVAKFPFIEVLPTSMFAGAAPFGKDATPLEILDKISSANPPWVAPVQGSLWIAAGITFTSFELINSQALVMVEAGSELVIALVGTSRAQFPQFGDMVYANIEMDLEVRFAPTEGVFSAQAVLASGSFLIDKACVLTGGFAFFVWYGPSPYAGDFVVSLGGYNPGFAPPNYYPAVPRVGFHWTIDSAITIQGGTYFALTPAALMVGGELNATYQSGNLKAWFDANADMVIRWKPFWFEAEIGVTIGASYKMNLLLTHSTFTVELGCDLEFWGPPSGGTVTVDWYIISFTIPFGHPRAGQQPDKLDGWPDFAAMLANTGTASQPNVLSLRPSSGLLPAGTKPIAPGPASAGTAPSQPPWPVRAGTFGFSASTPIPVTTATVGSNFTFPGTEFSVYPLQWLGVESDYVVTITDEANDDCSGSFDVDKVLGNIPASLWGSPPQGPSGPSVPNASDQLVAGQIVGISATVKTPQLGSSAGPVDVTYLAYDDLDRPGAILPLRVASPAGDIAVNDQSTISLIADAGKGIASPSATASRTAIYDGLASLKFAPDANDPMTKFAGSIGCGFAAEPLLVPPDVAAVANRPGPVPSMPSDTSPIGAIQFYDGYFPALAAGSYSIGITHTIRPPAGQTAPAPYTLTQGFSVSAPEFSIDPGIVQSLYPADGASGIYGQQVPYLVIGDPSLPWERGLTPGQSPPSQSNPVPWMALVLFAEGEVALPPQSNKLASTSTVSQFLAANADILKPSLPSDWVSAGLLESQCQTITIPGATFQAVFPQTADLPFLAHCRRVDTPGEDQVLIAVLLANRLPVANVSASPPAPLRYYAHLVSLEGFAAYLGPDAQPIPNKPNHDQLMDVQLASLYDWTFVSTPESGLSFEGLIDGLIRSEAATPTLQLPPPPEGADLPQAVVDRLQDGYAALKFVSGSGETSFAWYRGPFTSVEPRPLPRIGSPSVPASQATSADALMIYLADQGLFDLSYAAAWNLGRSLAMADASFSRAVNQIRRSTLRALTTLSQRSSMPHFAGDTDVASLLDPRASQRRFAWLIGDGLGRRWSEALDGARRGLVPRPAGPRRRAARNGPIHPRSMLARPEVVAALSEHIGEELEPIASWLGNLSLLFPVPFSHLVPDARMLPAESIRFFYVDQGWIDSLIGGAMSIAIKSTADLATFSALRETVDGAVARHRVRRHRRPASRTSPDPGTGPTTMTGMLIRSQLIPDWPTLVIGATVGEKKDLVTIVRDDCPSPSVRLCLFGGMPDAITLAEPYQGLRFGVEDNGVAPRYVTPAGSTGEPIPNATTIPPDGYDGFLQSYCRPNVGGVIQIASLASALDDAVGAKGTLGAGDFAIQLVQAPERQIFAPTTMRPGP